MFKFRMAGMSEFFKKFSDFQTNQEVDLSRDTCPFLVHPFLVHQPSNQPPLPFQTYLSNFLLQHKFSSTAFSWCLLHKKFAIMLMFVNRVGGVTLGLSFFCKWNRSGSMNFPFGCFTTFVLALILKILPSKPVSGITSFNNLLCAATWTLR